MNKPVSIRRSALSRHILLQYLLALTASTVLVAGFLAGSWWIAHQIIWQPDDPTYILLHQIKKWAFWIFPAVFLVVWGSVTLYFITRPLYYLDCLTEAARQLGNPSDTPIHLPSAIKTTQDEMNLIREQALRNIYLAKEAEQRKNDLIVCLAHDLKTPLTSVIGYLTLLQDEPQLSEAMRQRYTGIALDKAQRLEELINEFFDITRFKLSTLELELERINISRMLEQMVDEFFPILAGKQLTWEAHIQPDVEILCDPGKMERVFDNLIRNAISYSYPRSPITLTMTSDGTQVEITVTNRGRTIPPEKLSRIFEQFYRVDSARSVRTGGAGLGLAIAKELVLLHGGSIRAESQSESISFFLSLPANCQKIV